MYFNEFEKKKMYAPGTLCKISQWLYLYFPETKKNDKNSTNNMK